MKTLGWDPEGKQNKVCTIHTRTHTHTICVHLYKSLFSLFFWKNCPCFVLFFFGTKQGLDAGIDVERDTRVIVGKRFCWWVRDTGRCCSAGVSVCVSVCLRVYVCVRPLPVSKETYYSVKRDLLQCKLHVFIYIIYTYVCMHVCMAVCMYMHIASLTHTCMLTYICVYNIYINMKFANMYIHIASYLIHPIVLTMRSNGKKSFFFTSRERAHKAPPL